MPNPNPKPLINLNKYKMNKTETVYLAYIDDKIEDKEKEQGVSFVGGKPVT